MLKTTLLSAIALCATATIASADCIKLDINTYTFHNYCGVEMYVEFKTINGGCFQNRPGTFSFKANQTRHFPGLNKACGGGASRGSISWASCNYDEWRNGDCKPRF